MEEMKDKNANPQQDAATAEQSGGQGRTFTQDEVNQIVSDRLARERAKHEESPQEMKEKELSARESRLSCREYIIKEKLPVELLDLFPTGDMDSFKASVKKLKEAFPNVYKRSTGMTFSTGTSHGTGIGSDDISHVFTKGRTV